MNTQSITQSEFGRKIMWAATLWVAAGLMAAANVRADIYSWQDAEGVIHFSNQDAPPHADIYMKEPAPGPREAETQDTRPLYRQKLELEAARQQARTEAKLEEANQRLNRALEKVDELTDRVSHSQAQAVAAAEAAQQAAIAAEREAQAASAASYSEKNDKRSIVVYSSPYYYPYRYKKQGHKYHKPNHTGHIKKRNPYDNSFQYYKHKFKHKRHYYYNKGPVPKVPKRSHAHRTHRFRSGIK